ncbi:metabolite traffic protein EboE [Coleofasciculus sp. G2-EDA-02]|uniref:metabolite traffic protein EboE n=1 Tax=Coleofasciculus sp. G2-EDA-02 TaxID=3069529 RepID=UPI0032FFF109
MKIQIDSGFHLTYCTNIHPGEEWKKVFLNLEQYIPILKAQLSPTKPFGVGLRLADVAARELLEADNLTQFQAWLTEQKLYVFTLNGFPYGGFHHQVVKDQVYAPDWSKQERLDYTMRLTKILAALLPEGMDGGISTLPLSYKPWWKEDKTMSETVLKDSSFNLTLLVEEMVRLQEETGKLLHIDLEPEPDGLIENADEVIDFFQNWLLPMGGAYLAERLGISPESAEAKILDHVRVCYDTCHFAVEYEEPASVFSRFQSAGIKIGKIQISAALKVIVPQDYEDRNQVFERLRPFAESTYLHQVIERRSDGGFYHYPDLETALPQLQKSPAQEWRTHFHVPIFIHDYQLLQSTQDDIITVLKLLQENPTCQHLEIETYTWDVLPAEMKMDLLASIQREYEWVLGTMSAGSINSKVSVL